MENYRLVIDFHAENDEDAREQTRRALDGIDDDDGYDSATLETRPVRIVSQFVQIEAET